MTCDCMSCSLLAAISTVRLSKFHATALQHAHPGVSFQLATGEHRQAAELQHTVPRVDAVGLCIPHAFLQIHASLAAPPQVPDDADARPRETFLGSPTRAQSADVFSMEDVAAAYLRPLSSRAPDDILRDPAQVDLAQTSLLEQFERAQQFISRRQPALTPDCRRALEVSSSAPHAVTPHQS